MLQNNLPKQDNQLEPLENPSQVTGFASPAGDYAQERLHIIQQLVKDPTNTYYFEMESDDMQPCGIIRGALLVVDRSLKAKSGSIVVVNAEGQWRIRMLLEYENKNYLTTGEVNEQSTLIGRDGINIFGVVAWSCNPMSGVKSLIVK